MSRNFIRIDNEGWRAKAMEWVAKAPLGTIVSFVADSRTNKQNALLWPLLQEISQKANWHGVKLPKESWKLIFMSGLREEMSVVPNLNGTGFIPLGTSSRALTKKEFSDLIEIIYAWCAQNNIEPEQREAA